MWVKNRYFKWVALVNGKDSNLRSPGALSLPHTQMPWDRFCFLFIEPLLKVEDMAWDRFSVFRRLSCQVMLKIFPASAAPTMVEDASTAARRGEATPVRIMSGTYSMPPNRGAVFQSNQHETMTFWAWFQVKPT